MKGQKPQQKRFRSPYGLLNDKAFLKRSHLVDRRSLREIADTVGCSRHALTDAMGRHGIPIHGRDRPRELDDRRWLARAYVKEGKSAHSIAGVLGCSDNMVLGALRRHGIPIRPRRPPRHPLLNQKGRLYDLYWDQRLPIPAIAAKLGCSPSAVRAALHRHGIEVRLSGKQPIPQLYSPSWLKWHLARQTPAEIAELLGVSEVTVRSALWRSGLRPGAGRPGHPTQLDDGRWLANQVFGRRRSLTSIARELDCAVGTVSAAVRRHNIRIEAMR